MPLKTPVFHTTPTLTATDILDSLGYKLGESIGSGAFATVYKASKGDQVCACKVLKMPKDRSSQTSIKKQNNEEVKPNEFMEELSNELKILSSLSHPNIIPLYFHAIIDNQMYIFMEYAPNGSLSEYVRKHGPISEDLARKWFGQIVDAVSYIHKKGITHRDLKLDSSDNCKVTDFGLSRVSYKPSKGILYCTSCCGTEPYMAPEILIKRADGTRLYDPIAADVWALGVCLYAMLNRAYPFNPQNRQTMIHNQLQKKWKFIRKLRSKLSPELKDLLSNLMEPNPRKRITLMGVRSHPWMLLNKVNALPNMRPKYVAAGFKQDLEQLVSQFLSLKSIRYSDFASCWKSMQFSFIFTGKLNTNELKDFIEEAFLIVLNGITDGLPEKRIACLYTLYALYVTQPLTNKIPIRLTQEELISLRDIYEQCLKNGHSDVCYVWLKLLSLGACLFVAYKRPLGPYYIPSNRIIPSEDEKNSGREKFLRSLNEQIEELHEIHQNYRQMINSLEGEEMSDIKELNLVKDDIFKHFKSITQKLTRNEKK